MAEQLKVLFGRELQKQLFPKSSYLMRSKFDGTVAANQNSVNVPSAGDISVTKNATVEDGGLTSSARGDDSLNYTLDKYSIGPHFVEDANEAVLNYSKRQDIVQAAARSLMSRVAQEAAVAWAPSGADAKIVRTSGDAGNTLMGGGSGNRLAVTKNDIIRANIMLDNDDVPDEGRVLLIPASLYGEILNINDFVDADKIGRANLPDGVIGRILGADVYVTSKTPLFSNAPAPVKKAVGASGAAADNGSILLYHEDFVRRAHSNPKIYVNADRAEYLGSLISGMMRFGASQGRVDKKGVVAIVQAHGT